MQGARKGPRMDKDPVGSRHWVAGGPVGYKQVMRDGRGGRGQERGGARAAQQPLWDGAPRDAASGPLTGSGKGERDIAGSRTNRRRPKGCAGGGKARGLFIGGPEGAPVRAAA